MKTPEQLKGTIRSMAAKKNLRAQEVLLLLSYMDTNFVSKKYYTKER